jgi:hypothetical protein
MCVVGLLVSWTRDVAFGRCGRPVGAAEPSPWPAVAGCGEAEPGYVRPDLAMCGRSLLMWHVGSNFFQNVYYLWNSQNNSWNFISTKNVHETCHILLSNESFDGRIFVVRTVYKLPQANHFFILEQSLELASVDQELHDVITQQVPVHKLHALLAILKRLVWDNLSLTLPVGLVAFHPSFGGWRVEWFLTLYLSLFFFSGSYLRVFWKFYKERQGSSDGFLDRSSGICYLTKGFEWASTSYSMVWIWRFG